MKVQHFTHFTITTEVHNGGSRRSTLASPKRVGRFQLFSDSLTKFNDRCVNTVSEADDLPKTEIQVMWVAPESGSGCVSLSAMVYEDPRAWFADDGQLTQVICEKKANSDTAHKECCACDEAKYSGENNISTDGFRSLAEWGSPSALEAELRVKGPRLRTLIKAPGLWYPNVNTNTTSKFRVDRKHPKVSMASMFGPSPDWVVGINGVDLCTDDCSWKESLDMGRY